MANKAMKILVLALHFGVSGYIGGGWVRFVELLRRSEKYDIHYVLIEPKPLFKTKYHRLDYEVEELNVQKSVFKLMIELILVGLKRARRHDIDLILSPVENCYSVLPAFILSKLTAIPWTATLQLAPLYGYLVNKNVKTYTSSFRDIYRFLKLEAVRRATPVSPVIAALIYWITYKAMRSPLMLTSSPTVSEDLKIIDKKIKTLTCFPGYAIDYERISSIPQQDKKFDLLFTSLSPLKGLFDVINSLTLMVRKRPETKLAIIGSGSKYIVEQLTEMISARKLFSNVVFPYGVGKGAGLEEIWKLMGQSKVLIHPSRVESWSLTIGEALTLGLPVITYDIKPIRLAYKNCPAVFRVPVGNHHDIAEVTLKLLEDKDLYRRVSEAALEYMKHYYSWDDVIKAEKEAYMKILSYYRKGGRCD